MIHELLRPSLHIIARHGLINNSVLNKSQLIGFIRYFKHGVYLLNLYTAHLTIQSDSW